MKRKRVAEHVKNRRPRPLTPDQLVQASDIELTRHLLSVSLQRLDAGRSLERKRHIVYPEITCIVRDCERLQRRIHELEGRSPAPLPGDAAPPPSPEPPKPSASASFWDS